MIKINVISLMKMSIEFFSGCSATTFLIARLQIGLRDWPTSKFQPIATARRWLDCQQPKEAIEIQCHPRSFSCGVRRYHCLRKFQSISAWITRFSSSASDKLKFTTSFRLHSIFHYSSHSPAKFSSMHQLQKRTNKSPITSPYLVEHVCNV